MPSRNSYQLCRRDPFACHAIYVSLQMSCCRIIYALLIFVFQIIVSGQANVCFRKEVFMIYNPTNYHSIMNCKTVFHLQIPGFGFVSDGIEVKGNKEENQIY